MSVRANPDGTSPLASPAGVTQTPDAAPVWSGQVGFAGSALVLLKYGGTDGASSAAAGRLIASTAAPIMTPSTTIVPLILRIALPPNSGIGGLMRVPERISA